MPLAARLLALPLLALALMPASAADPIRVIYPEKDREVAAALLQPVQTNLVGELREVLAELARAHQIHVLIDEQAIVDSGATVDDEIEFLAVGVPLGQVLDKLLRPMELTYVAEHGVLKITTEKVARSKPLVRAYDVKPLLDESTDSKAVGDAVSKIIMRQYDSEMNGPPDRSSPTFAPFRSLLVVVGNPTDHQRVQEALELLSHAE